MSSRNSPDFSTCSRLAEEILLSSGQSKFPIKLKKIVSKLNIALIDFARLDVDYGFTIMSSNNDGGAIKSEDGRYAIIYNREIIKPRMVWTIAHELGHIILGHHDQINKKDYDVMEVEANFFAAELLMPTALIKILVNFGCTISCEFLTEKFGVSNEAARKKIETLNKWNSVDQSTADHMSIIFRDFVNESSTLSSFTSTDSFERDFEMQKERDAWNS